MRVVVIAIVALCSLSSRASGQMFTLLRDGFDDRNTINAASDDPAVKQFRADLQAFEQRLLRLKEKHILALLGQPLAKQEKTFAMPVAGPRLLGLPGIRSADEKENKDHWEFHRLTDQIGLHIYYHTDGISPCTVLYHFRVDATFPRLTKDNLKTRLAWDRKHFDALKREFDRRWAALYVWEVDPEEEKEIYKGEHSLDCAKKLEGWVARGKKLGLRHEYKNEDYILHRWYRADGTLEREASANPTVKVPQRFIVYDTTGRLEIQNEWGGSGAIDSLRWTRAGTTDTIRYETSSGRPHHWSWFDRKGKLVRYEWDDNDDGVPDFVREKEGDKNGKLLQIEDSWAVHPKLIPAESRIPDQPERRVPLRKIKAPPAERN